MTTGRGSEPVAQCRSRVPISITSALLLSSSTVARRTVQTLIGSYVALSTSTRPPDQRPVPSASGPRRWKSLGGTDPTGAGGTALVAIAAPKCSQADPGIPWPGARCTGFEPHGREVSNGAGALSMPSAAALTPA